MKANSLLTLILALALAAVIGKMAIDGRGNKASVAADSTSVVAGNAAIENIMTRASVRAYQNRPVEDGKIDTLLRAAMAAPTAADKRPWRFVVVTEKDQIEALAKTNERATFMTKAPLIIVVCGDMRRALDGPGRDYWIQDVSAATENMLLAAHALGLGAVWTGCYPSKERYEAVARVLELPKEVVPLAVVVVGYPAQPVQPKDKWDEDLVSYDAYDE